MLRALRSARQPNDIVPVFLSRRRSPGGIFVPLGSLWDFHVFPHGFGVPAHSRFLITRSGVAGAGVWSSWWWLVVVMSQATPSPRAIERHHKFSGSGVDRSFACKDALRFGALALDGIRLVSPLYGESGDLAERGSEMHAILADEKVDAAWFDSLISSPGVGVGHSAVILNRKRPTVDAVKLWFLTHSRDAFVKWVVNTLNRDFPEDPVSRLSGIYQDGEDDRIHVSERFPYLRATLFSALGDFSLVLEHRSGALSFVVLDYKSGVHAKRYEDTPFRHKFKVPAQLGAQAFLMADKHIPSVFDGKSGLFHRFYAAFITEELFWRDKGRITEFPSVAKIPGLVFVGDELKLREIGEVLEATAKSSYENIREFSTVVEPEELPEGKRPELGRVDGDHCLYCPAAILCSATTKEYAEAAMRIATAKMADFEIRADPRVSSMEKVLTTQNKGTKNAPPAVLPAGKDLGVAAHAALTSLDYARFKDPLLSKVASKFVKAQNAIAGAAAGLIDEVPSAVRGSYVATMIPYRETLEKNYRLLEKNSDHLSRVPDDSPVRKVNRFDVDEVRDFIVRHPDLSEALAVVMIGTAGTRDEVDALVDMHASAGASPAFLKLLRDAKALLSPAVIDPKTDLHRVLCSAGPTPDDAVRVFLRVALACAVELSLASERGAELWGNVACALGHAALRASSHLRDESAEAVRLFLDTARNTPISESLRIVVVDVMAEAEALLQSIDRHGYKIGVFVGDEPKEDEDEDFNPLAAA